MQLAFQPTRSRIGAVRFVKQIEHVPYVSIHAPAWGATFQQFAATSGIGVSIHAFEREQGHHRRRDRTEVLRFNPRCVWRNHSFPEYSAPSLLVHASRAGRDDLLQCPGPGCTFQLACLARGLSNGAAHWVCNREFQSTCPAGHDDVGNGTDRSLSVSRLAHSNSINSTPLGMRARSILIS